MYQFLKLALPVATTLALSMAAAPVHADSSSAGSASSESVGSSSTSIQKSSDSSSKKDKVAQGQYKVFDMAELTEQPGMVRVRLQALAPVQAEEFFLILPRQAAERGQLGAGQIVLAQHRPYGLAFASTDATGQANPFFLVLDDDWHRELESRPVVL